MQSHFLEACRKTEVDDDAFVKTFLDKHPNQVNNKAELESLAFWLIDTTRSMHDISYVRDLIRDICCVGVAIGCAAESIGIADKANLYLDETLLDIAVKSNSTNTALLLLQRGANITPSAEEYCDKHNPAFLRVFGQFNEFHSNQLALAQVHYINAGAAVSRKDIKRIERKLIKTKANVNDATGGRKQTALHRAAIYGFFKQYKTLLHLQADATLVDYHNKTPADYLTGEQYRRINDIEPDYRRLQESTVDVIMSSIVSIGPYNANALRVALDNIYQLPELTPLLDLIKLALLGHHCLSGRFTNAENEYDSDEECEIESRHKLKIQVDPNNDDVSQLYVMGTNGTGGKKASGVHNSRNGIFVGINNPVSAYVGTLIHEICHFVANEVFQNNCNPYFDKYSETKYMSLVKALQNNKQHMPPEFISMLDSASYTADEYPCETVVRIPQIIARRHLDGLNGKDELNRRPETAELLLHYTQVFLPAVTEHIEKLTDRAHHHWQPDLFK